MRLIRVEITRSNDDINIWILPNKRIKPETNECDAWVHAAYLVPWSVGNCFDNDIVIIKTPVAIFEWRGGHNYYWYFDILYMILTYEIELKKVDFPINGSMKFIYNVM